MLKNVKKIVKGLIPPIFTDWNKFIPKKYGYFGNYADWQSAQKVSIQGGYSNDIIIHKVRERALTVKADEKSQNIPWALFGCLMWIGAQNNTQLEIIDFGGSLGTSYYQMRNLLKDLGTIHWHVIEQEKFVNIGKKEFTDSILDFYIEKDLHNLVQTRKPQVMIISSSIQYLPDPYDFIEKLFTLNIPYLIFDRTTFFIDNNLPDRLMLQKIPPEIYDACFPVWVLNQNHFIEKISKHYSIISDFLSDGHRYTKFIQETENGSVHQKGFLFKKKKP